MLSRESSVPFMELVNRLSPAELRLPMLLLAELTSGRLPLSELALSE